MKSLVVPFIAILFTGLLSTSGRAESIASPSLVGEQQEPRGASGSDGVLLAQAYDSAAESPTAAASTPSAEGTKGEHLRRLLQERKDREKALEDAKVVTEIIAWVSLAGYCLYTGGLVPALVASYAAASAPVLFLPALGIVGACVFPGCLIVTGATIARLIFDKTEARTEEVAEAQRRLDDAIMAF